MNKKNPRGTRLRTRKQVQELVELIMSRHSKTYAEAVRIYLTQFAVQPEGTLEQVRGWEYIEEHGNLMHFINKKEGLI